MRVCVRDTHHIPSLRNTHSIYLYRFSLAHPETHAWTLLFVRPSSIFYCMRPSSMFYCTPGDECLDTPFCKTFLYVLLYTKNTTFLCVVLYTTNLTGVATRQERSHDSPRVGSLRSPSPQRRPVRTSPPRWVSLYIVISRYPQLTRRTPR